MATVSKRKKKIPHIFGNCIAFDRLLCYHESDVFAAENAPTVSLSARLRSGNGQSSPPGNIS